MRFRELAIAGTVAAGVLVVPGARSSASPAGSDQGLKW
jgi:hypothetical protein